MENKRMGFAEAIKTCNKKIFDYKGRARRSEFWWWALFSAIIGISLSIIALPLPTISLVIQLPVSIYFALVGMSVTTRRLHDTGRSGWWYAASIIAGVVLIIWFVIETAIFTANINSGNVDNVDTAATGFIASILIPLIPYWVYSIVLLVWCCQDSQPGENKYGANPKSITDCTTEEITESIVE